MSVPMSFPWTNVPMAPSGSSKLAIMMPACVLFEMMFCAAATVPPMVVLGAEFDGHAVIAGPEARPPVTPSAANPMMFPAIRVPPAEA